jgi:hypothetical protein
MSKHIPGRLARRKREHQNVPLRAQMASARRLTTLTTEVRQLGRYLEEPPPGHAVYR